jgi:hypothetical protein
LVQLEKFLRKYQKSNEKYQIVSGLHGRKECIKMLQVAGG